MGWSQSAHGSSPQSPQWSFGGWLPDWPPSPQWSPDTVALCQGHNSTTLCTGKRGKTYKTGQSETFLEVPLEFPPCAAPFFMKDIGLLAEGNDGDDNSLSLDVLQVGLRQQTHSLAAAVLGEDERVAAEPHGAGLEAVAVHADGHVVES